MTDLELAIRELETHTLVLCKDGEFLQSDRHGVAPMLDFLREGRDLSGCSAADRVVGKAVAMLFLKAGIREVYAKTLSEGAETYLTAHGIPVQAETRTKRILNRAGTGPCPMEATVTDTEDAEEGYLRLCAKLDEMRGQNPTGHPAGSAKAPQ